MSGLHHAIMGGPLPAAFDIFGVHWRKAFCGEIASAPADSGQETIKQLIGLNLGHQEWVHSNLLPVIALPPHVYGAPLPLNPPNIMTAEETKSIPRVKEAPEKAWSLGLLTSPKIARLVGCDPKQVETRAIEQWLLWPKQRNWFIELLNKQLQIKCANLGMAYDTDHHRFYFTPENGGPRTATYRAYARKATRQLAYPYYDKDSGELRFWVHQAARLSFVEFDRQFYMKVEPGYAFTKDGSTFLASEDIGPLATRRKSGERNQNVFNHLIFWREILAESRDDIIVDFGGQSMMISKAYESGKPKFGIPADSRPLVEIAMAEDELDLELLTQGKEDEETH